VPSRTLLIAVGVGLAIAIGAGVSYAAGDRSAGTDGAPVSFAPLGAAPGETFASPDDALSSALKNEFAGTAIDSASFGSIPDGAPSSADGLWLDVTVAATNDSVGATLGDWESAMLIGYLQQALHDSGLPQIGGFSIKLSLPDGSTADLGGGGPGNVAFGQQFVSTPEDAVAASLKRDASAAGVTITSLQFLHTGNTVPIVTVTASDAMEFVSAHPSVTGVFSDSGPFEGIYVLVQDAQGRPVEMGSASFRSGIGAAWYAPGYDGGDRGAGNGTG